jgi:hypothetical protein
MKGCLWEMIHNTYISYLDSLVDGGEVYQDMESRMFLRYSEFRCLWYRLLNFPSLASFSRLLCVELVKYQGHPSVSTGSHWVAVLSFPSLSLSCLRWIQPYYKIFPSESILGIQSSSVGPSLTGSLAKTCWIGSVCFGGRVWDGRKSLCLWFLST